MVMMLVNFFLINIRMVFSLKGPSRRVGADWKVQIRTLPTNNTPADLANSSQLCLIPVDKLPASNDLDQSFSRIVFYTTANNNDTLQIFAGLNALPDVTNGPSQVKVANIVAVRLAV